MTTHARPAVPVRRLATSIVVVVGLALSMLVTAGQRAMADGTPATCQPPADTVPPQILSVSLNHDGVQRRARSQEPGRHGTRRRCLGQRGRERRTHGLDRLFEHP